MQRDDSGDETQRFHALLEEIDELNDDLDMPGTARHLEHAREKVVDAHRVFDWERR